MIRELFRIGDFAISPFGVLLVCAFVAAYWQLRWGFRHLEIGDEEDASAVLFAAGFGGVVGAKIYYAILYGDWHVLIERSGLVWYGGFILGTAAVLWILWRRALPLWPSFDCAAPAVAIGYGVGRIGCFLVGDDYGLPTDLPWGVKFPRGLPPSNAGWLRSEFGVELPADVPDSELLAVHPTQLYETVAAVAIFLAGRRLLRRRLAPGVAGLSVVALLAVERFLIELIRAKDDRWLDGITTAQLISVGILLVIAGVWLARRQELMGSGERS